MAQDNDACADAERMHAHMLITTRITPNFIGQMFGTSKAMQPIRTCNATWNHSRDALVVPMPVTVAAISGHMS